MQPPPPDANTFRIFVSTDNHLGFGEDSKYPPRADDSFRAVEEVLTNAKKYESDILLMGGDLFHDNKPSRPCMVKTMKLFREYVFGDRPVQVDATSVKSCNCDAKGERGHVNWEDEHMNIGLPVFIIHGNHDDPTGKGNYSALDELSVNGLLNYFGKQTSTENIVINPVILTKGTCKVAIYGIGNIKDERLHEAFRKDQVKFEPPANKEEYFHILVIHQNRAHKGNNKNFIPTEMLPDFIEFIIWGHEHESLIQPESVFLKNNKEAHLTQPGSTVQTSFIAAEAVPKHMAYLDIQQQPRAPGSDPVYRYRFKALEHKMTRPFMYEEIFLSNEIMPNGNAIEPTEEGVMKYLEKKVKAMVKVAEKEFPDRPPLVQKPLIRIKVEHTGYPLIAPRKFGKLFKEADDASKWPVANPDEVLLFWRKLKEGARKPRLAGEDAQDDDPAFQRRELLEAPEITDLVQEELDKKSSNLEVLTKVDLFEAVKEFVEKEEINAIKNMVSDQLKEVRETFGKHVQSGALASCDNEKELMEQVKKLLETRQKEPRSASQGASRTSASRAGGADSAAASASPGSIPPSSAPAAAGRGRGKANGAAAVGRGAGRGAGAARGRGGAAGKVSQKTSKAGSAAKRKRGEWSDVDDASEDVKQESDDDSEDQGDRRRVTSGVGRGKGAAAAKAGARSGASKTATSSQQSSAGDSAAAGGRPSRVAARNNGAAADESLRSSKRRRGNSSDEQDSDVECTPSATASSTWGA